MRKSGEDLALMLSVALLLGCFGYTIWAGSPRVRTWTVKVFEVHTYGDRTLVMSYGSGYMNFAGVYNLTAGKTYVITYLTGAPPKLLSAEEIG